MRSAVIVVKIPEQRRDWRRFTGDVTARTEIDENVVRLGRNVWLVDVHRSPAGLGWLISLCEQHNVSYGILPLADQPQWLPVGFDPKSIREK